jgi:tRNA(adenine34) deaminase
MITDKDLGFLRQAIKLAENAKKIKNLPIGAIITLDDEIIGQGKNSIWFPKYQPNRHAEIEAIESIQKPELWGRSADMTLYTTLEPCLMCLGTILVHRIGRIVFGSSDPHGGALCVFGHMPYAFENLWLVTKWLGPALPEECDKLSNIVIEMAKSHKQEKWSEQTPSIWDSIIDPNFNSLQFKQSLTSRHRKNSQE